MLIQPSVIKDWTAVVYKHGAWGLHLHKEIIDARDEVNFHGDAIHYLQLSQPVIRPVSLEQIRREQEVHDEWKEWRSNERKEHVREMESWHDPNWEHQVVMASLQEQFGSEESEDDTH